MSAIVYSSFRLEDVARLADIDRSEVVKTLYKVRDGALVALDHGCRVPPWSGEALAEMTAFARDRFEAGGEGWAAFAGGRLVGVAVLGHAPVRGDPRELQLALLYVSRAYRRRGVAGRLFDVLREAALRRGARRLYVSATPSDSAVGFYLSRGARLAAPVDAALFALEPEDVHLVVDL